MECFDVVVIGGGPAGSAAAILLAEAGWSVALVEHKPFPRRKVCGEYLSATNWPLLARLGVLEAFVEAAGPPVTATAVFAKSARYAAPLPRMGGEYGYGRALSRERLDTLLIRRAEALGVAVFQPARCTELAREGSRHRATIEKDGASTQLLASVAIAAHGSWERGELPTQHVQSSLRPTDWLAFKAHFRGANLPSGLMPLVCFQDGYGGLVECDGGRVSLSFCVRRSRLARLARGGGVPAGEAAFWHVLESCPAVRSVLESAARDGAWLSAGVIRPGIRPRFRNGVFIVGNAAGEAHPVVAEGISMALQGGWLLTETIKTERGSLRKGVAPDAWGRQYAAAWRRAFAPRIVAAAALAQWASRPSAVKAVAPLLAAFPGMVTHGARLSGKSRIVVPEPNTTPAASGHA